MKRLVRNSDLIRPTAKCFSKLGIAEGLVGLLRLMLSPLLSPKEAAPRLGISVTTLYDWLGQSDWGSLVVRGEPVTIAYFQGGPGGQGRIRIEASEVERLRDLMRVVPQQPLRRPPPIRRDPFPGIRVPLGRPSE